MKVLLVTNDFPPRVGGIQRYLWSLYRDLARHDIEVRVLAPDYREARKFDATVGVEVVRHPDAVYWPTASLRTKVRELSRDADVVTFGAMLPMNLLARSTGRPVVVHTHGFEVAWTRVPGLRAMLRRIAGASSLMTTVSRFCHEAIERAVGGRAPLEMLVTGVDLERFRPGLDASLIRERHGIADRPVVACVSRLVQRKGQDLLIDSFEQVRAALPSATLLLVGGGPHEATLRRKAAGLPPDAVVFTGEVAEEDLPLYYAVGDVFAMPCRSRFGQLEVEGLGLVYLEAQACARPAITGDSGGAPEAVREGETGFVVPGDDAVLLGSRLVDLLGDTQRRTQMGEAGRRYVETHHRWADVVDRFAAMLRNLR